MPPRTLQKSHFAAMEIDIWDIGMQRALTRVSAGWNSRKPGTRGLYNSGRGEERKRAGKTAADPGDQKQPRPSSGRVSLPRKLYTPSKTIPKSLSTSKPHTKRKPTPSEERARLLSDFHHALSTQDLSHFWPAYVALNRDGVAERLTRRAYYQLFLYVSRLPNTINNLRRLLTLFDDMTTRGLRLRQSEYNILIHWVGGETVPRRYAAHLAKAMSIFDRMQLGDRDGDHLNRHAQRAANDDGLAHRPHRVAHYDRDTPSLISQEPSRPPSRGIPPDVVTLNTLIRVACEVHDLRSAQRLYDDMISRDMRPDVRTFTSLIHAFAKMGDVEAMERMRDAMRKAGVASSSVVTWNAVMQ
ncbi:hypothetical protein BC938DRAFT_473779, partial [Jimgerdemannia flammicorona]